MEPERENGATRSRPTRKLFGQDVDRLEKSSCKRGGLLPELTGLASGNVIAYAAGGDPAKRSDGV